MKTGAFFCAVLAWNLAAVAAITTSPGPGGGGGSGSSTNATVVSQSVSNAFILSQPVYVAATGNDTAAGTIAAPLATVSNAVQRVNGTGQIIVRGGNYFNDSANLSNAGILNINNYQGETPTFYFGYNIPAASFGVLSNGIYTNIPSTTISNSIQGLKAFWNGNPPTGQGFYIYQTNVAFGNNTAINFQLHSLNSRLADTNRLEHTPMTEAVSIPAMVNSNALYWFTNGILYVKFAVSNSAGGIYIPSTNATDAFIYGGTNSTHVTVQGITTEFGYEGFDVGGSAETTLIGCRAIGNSYGVGGNALIPISSLTPGLTVGKVTLIDDEISPCGMGISINPVLNQVPWAKVSVTGCYLHDTRQENCQMRAAAYATFQQTTAAYGEWGFVDDGSQSFYSQCNTFSNSQAGFQMGYSQVIGYRSMQWLDGCRMDGDLVCIRMDADNDVLFASACTFDNTGTTPISITGTAATETARVSRCTSLNGATIYAGAGYSAGRCTVDLLGFGNTAYVTTGTLQLYGTDAAAGATLYMNGVFTLNANGDIVAHGGNLTAGWTNNSVRGFVGNGTFLTGVVASLPPYALTNNQNGSVTLTNNLKVMAVNAGIGTIDFTSVTSSQLPGIYMGANTVTETSVNYTLDVDLSGNATLNSPTLTTFFIGGTTGSGMTLTSNVLAMASGAGIMQAGAFQITSNSITYQVPIIQAGTTNLSAATSIKVVFPKSMPSTNYSANFTGYGTTVAAPFVSAKTLTGFTANMTSFTGLIDWVATQQTP